MANCLICGGESQAIQMHKGCFDAMLAGIIPNKFDRCPICSRREKCDRKGCRFSSDLFMLRMAGLKGKAELE